MCFVLYFGVLLFFTDCTLIFQRTAVLQNMRALSKSEQFWLTQWLSS